jgi:hypothetical protein
MIRVLTAALLLATLTSGCAMSANAPVTGSIYQQLHRRHRRVSVECARGDHDFVHRRAILFARISERLFLAATSPHCGSRSNRPGLSVPGADFLVVNVIQTAG